MATGQTGPARTLCDMFRETASSHGTQPALIERDPDGAGWRTFTWGEYQRQVEQVAKALIASGVEHGDNVAIMAVNRPEHVIADIGILFAGGTPISVYNTFAPEQTAYIAKDSAAKVAIVDQEYLEKWQGIRGDLPDLKQLVVLDGDAPEGVTTWEEFLASGSDVDDGAFENAWRAVTPDDPATIIYTSGTTGPPKGVVLTHVNMLFQLTQLDNFLDLEPGRRGVSYLPLAHIAERMTTHYTAIEYAGTVYFARSPKLLLETMQQARPNTIMAVPRVWEKLHAGILAKLADEPDERKRKIANRAIDVGTEVVRRERQGQKVGLFLKAQHALFDRLVFSKIREGVGLDQCDVCISGAAPISMGLLEFFEAIGLPILEVYGMTESTAVITANRPDDKKLGTVGLPVPNTEVKIADDGEVLARGEHITPGYLNRPDATKETIDEDGWLHTGDLGEIDRDGFLKIIGRKKELIITAGGKNLSPNNIEEEIKQQSPLIAQVCAIGDDRRFISALIVLDAEVFPSWAKENGVTVSSLAEAADDPKVRAEIQRAVDAGNEHLARVEQVKAWRLLGNEWTPESEEMTPSLKLKRHVIHSKYSDVIDAMYD